MSHHNQHLHGYWMPPPPSPGPRPAVGRLLACLLLAVLVSAGVIGAAVIWIARTFAIAIVAIGTLL